MCKESKISLKTSDVSEMERFVDNNIVVNNNLSGDLKYGTTVEDYDQSKYNNALDFFVHHFSAKDFLLGETELVCSTIRSLEVRPDYSNVTLTYDCYATKSKYHFNLLINSSNGDSNGKLILKFNIKFSKSGFTIKDFSFFSHQLPYDDISLNYSNANVTYEN
jgi:hypothetical protein